MMKRKCPDCKKMILVNEATGRFARHGGGFLCAGSGKEPVKKGLFDGYQTYNPEQEGYGNPDEWRDAFSRRFGKEEIEEILGSDSPWDIIGVSSKATYEEAKSAFRKKAIELHPDKNHDRDTTKEFQRLQAAWQKIEELLK